MHQDRDSLEKSVLQQEAVSENTSAARLLELAKLNTELARLVAKNPNTDSQLLLELGSSSDKKTLQCVASNPNTPTQVLWKLGEEFPEEVLSNPVFSLLMLENPNLLKEIPTETLCSLLKAKAIPEEYLVTFVDNSNYSDWEALLAVVANAKTPKSVLEKLIEKYKADEENAVNGSYLSSVAEAALLHVNWAGEMSEGWEEAALTAMQTSSLSDGTEEEAVLWKIGAIPEYLLSALHPDTWLILVGDSDTPEHILLEIAKNSELGTPEDILHRIAKNSDLGDKNYLRNEDLISLAENPNTPISVLEELVGHHESLVREAVACNPKIPLALLQEFQLQQAAIKNPLTSADTLEKLATSQWMQIRKGVAIHPNTPKNILQELALKKDWQTRLDLPKLTIPNWNEQNSHQTILKNLSLAQDMSARVLDKLALDTNTGVRESVARHPDTPVKALSKLAKDPCWNVRLTVASNPNTPLSTLEILAKDTSGQVKDAVLLRVKQTSEHSELLSKILQNLANTKDDRVLFIIARHPSTPAPVLEDLAKGVHRQWLAQHPNTPAAILLQLVNDRDPAVQKEALAHLYQRIIQDSDLPSSILEQSATLDNSAIKVALARHPNTPVNVLKQLAKHPKSQLRALVAKHPNTPVNLLEKLLEDTEKDTRLAAIAGYQQNFSQNSNKPGNILQQWQTVQNPETPSDILTNLATSRWLLIRENLALHPNASTPLLQQLAKDRSSIVRAGVAQNPNTPIELIQQLAKDKTQEVLRAVAQNPQTPDSIIEQLARKKKWNEVHQAAVKTLIQRGSKSVGKFLQGYAQSSKSFSFTRLIVFLNPLAPSSFLAKNFRSSCWLERYAIAQNPNTPPRIRQYLTEDSNRVVRAAAKAFLLS
ncbi:MULTISPECIES: hypothetical protein [Nostocales]|uniref:Leucine rich repeat variant n=3 Tax=Nostocales TaxID=1161 RepID=A0A0C1N9F1_9CYAN|nr:hypothetical protein [Tolypothrix bouteillei]KAF3887349.1 hypothetical protein DA73_0400019020 [Tolypothrix bouteillei VB521301]